eukprot:6900412-Prymnesium_polylepis.1
MPTAPGGGRCAGLMWAVTPARGREKSPGPSNRPTELTVIPRAGTEGKSQMPKPKSGTHKFIYCALVLVAVWGPVSPGEVRGG